MAEWLGNGLQNRVQQFDSAWYLKAQTTPSQHKEGVFFFFLYLHSERNYNNKQI